jgi:hypothetical protein
MGTEECISLSSWTVSQSFFMMKTPHFLNVNRTRHTANVDMTNGLKESVCSNSKSFLFFFNVMLMFSYNRT